MATYVAGVSLFDPTAYLNANLDVKAAAGNLTGQALANFALTHFVNFGAAEGRDPLGEAPTTTVATGKTAALTTTLTAGVATTGNFTGDTGGTGKSTGGVFDALFYLNNNTDVKAAAVAAVAAGQATSQAAFALAHFVQYGAAEGRAPSAGFNPAAYASTQTDVGKAITLGSLPSAIFHYLEFGEQEARPSPTIAGSASNGTTFTLTTNGDAFTGTANNDTFNGADTALNVADQLDGGAGVDTFNYTYSGTAAAITAASITNVEVFNMRNVGTGALTVDASQYVGATNFNADRATNGVIFTNVAQGQQIGDLGNGSATNGALTATYKAGVTSGTLNVSGGTTAGTVTITDGGTALTALTINSTGAANTLGGIVAPAAATAITINATTSLVTGGITNMPAATTITVTGTATNATTGTKVAVDLGTLAANVTTVDASGLTAGGIAAQLGAAAQKVTGGAGADTITTGGIVLTGTVNAGAGTDTLVVTAAADITATTGAKYTNFEILQNNSGASVNAAQVAGITSVALSGAGSSFTGLTATQAGAVSVVASDAGATLALADASGTSDVLNITGTTTATATAVNLTSLVVTGVETLKFANNATAASTLSFAGTGSTGLKTLTLTGTKGLTVDVAAAGTPLHAQTLTTIDASGLTAQATGTNTFTLQDTVGAHALSSSLVVTGSGGDDVFSFGTDTIATGVVQVNGGAGNDNLTASLAQLFTSGQGGLSFDGGANATGGDTLTISDAAAGTVSDSVFQHITNVENLVFTNTGALNLTAGGFFTTAFANGVTITDGATTTNNVTADFTVATGAVKFTNVGTTGVQAVTGGSGADTLTVTSAIAGTGAATVVIKGGAGADTIKETDTSAITTGGSIVIAGGTGTDKITLSVTDHAAAVSYVTLTEAVGDSTVGNADQVTGFYVTGATRLVDTIDFAGSPIKPAAGIASTAVTGHTVADLAFSVSTAGQLVFTGTSAAALTAAQVEAIWTAQVATGLNNLETVVWADANASDAQNGNSLVFNHNTGGDSEVILVGVQATAVGAAAATANLVGIV